jgi:hypothetical protein
MDPNSLWRDPDDCSLHSVWSASGSVEREIEMDATVNVSYDATAPHNITIDSVSFHENGVGVSIDETELATDYEFDQDDDHYDPQ